MGKMHELIVVESSLKAEKEAIGLETKTVFKKKAELFLGHIRRLEMKTEERQYENKEEQTVVDTTVKRKLTYMADFFTTYWDAKLQKEKTNQKGIADLIIENDDETEALKIPDLPVVFLLSMEEEIKQLRSIIKDIPTLSPGVEWVIDKKEGDDIYKTAKDEVVLREEKTVLYDQAAPATDKHQAIVKERTVTEPVGKYITTRWSGMISPAEKHAMLKRTDMLLKAFKQARMRGNDIEIEKGKIGKQLFDFILGK